MNIEIKKVLEPRIFDFTPKVDLSELKPRLITDTFGGILNTSKRFLLFKLCYLNDFT